MARRAALTSENLIALGAEKLATIILDEAGRNAPFKKLVAAALAGAQGPKAVAAVVDRRLAGLERARGFVEWEKRKSLRGRHPGNADHHHGRTRCSRPGHGGGSPGPLPDLLRARVRTHRRLLGPYPDHLPRRRRCPSGSRSQDAGRGQDRVGRASDPASRRRRLRPDRRRGPWHDPPSVGGWLGGDRLQDRERHRGERALAGRRAP